MTAADDTKAISDKERAWLLRQLRFPRSAEALAVFALDARCTAAEAALARVTAELADVHKWQANMIASRDAEAHSANVAIAEEHVAQAERDALAAKLAEAEAERDAYRQDAACLRHRAEAGDAAVAALAKLREEYGDSDSLRTYIGKFVSQRDRSEARAERLTAALAELVRLKGIKERLESWRLSPVDTEQERDDLWKHYECCKDLAWSDAREALAADTAEKGRRDAH